MTYRYDGGTGVLPSLLAEQKTLTDKGEEQTDEDKKRLKTLERDIRNARQAILKRRYRS
ncbi:MAG: hypothetical protein FWC51_01950 [Proteobacteria bacterium]|nr:hypothetical protein [Pseudomonadota bacterium]